MTSQRIAVLTGDLVHSTELGPEKIERAFKALEDCAQVQEAWHGAPLHFTRHRGDGWQVVLARPEMALRSALAFRAALRAEGEEFDSYVGISDGNASQPIGPNLNSEISEVFREAGSALEEAKEPAMPKIWYPKRPKLNAVAILADAILQTWTLTQARSALPFLAPLDRPTQENVAKSLGKSRQAISKALISAHTHTLNYALECIEGTAHD